MDRDLVEQARGGDRDAFAALVHQVSDRLYSVAFRILRDGYLAEDALQNALVTAWRQVPHLRDLDRFEAWIHRILVHSCYAEARRSRRWTTAVRVLPSPEEHVPDASLSLADRDDGSAVDRDDPNHQSRDRGDGELRHLPAVGARHHQVRRGPGALTDLQILSPRGSDPRGL